MDREEAVTAVIREVTANKENAEKFLKGAGIMDKNGQLAKQYRPGLTEEESSLLLKDLSVRMHYDVIVECDGRLTRIESVNKFGEVQPEGCNFTVSVDEVRPYLYDYNEMSMNPTLREEFSKMVRAEGLHFDNVTDFYHRHHVDYKGMIKKGLANRITNDDNPYKKYE